MFKLILHKNKNSCLGFSNSILDSNPSISLTSVRPLLSSLPPHSLSRTRAISSRSHALWARERATPQKGWFIYRREEAEPKVGMEASVVNSGLFAPTTKAVCQKLAAHITNKPINTLVLPNKSKQLNQNLIKVLRLLLLQNNNSGFQSFLAGPTASNRSSRASQKERFTFFENKTKQKNTGLSVDLDLVYRETKYGRRSVPLETFGRLYSCLPISKQISGNSPLLSDSQRQSVGLGLHCVQTRTYVVRKAHNQQNQSGPVERSRRERRQGLASVCTAQSFGIKTKGPALVADQPTFKKKRLLQILLFKSILLNQSRKLQEKAKGMPRFAYYLPVSFPSLPPRNLGLSLLRKESPSLGTLGKGNTFPPSSSVPNIQKKSFVSYWLLPFLGFYFLLAKDRNLNRPVQVDGVYQISLLPTGKVKGKAPQEVLTTDSGVGFGGWNSKGKDPWTVAQSTIPQTESKTISKYLTAVPEVRTAADSIWYMPNTAKQAPRTYPVSGKPFVPNLKKMDQQLEQLAVVYLKSGATRFPFPSFPLESKGKGIGNGSLRLGLGLFSRSETPTGQTKGKNYLPLPRERELVALLPLRDAREITPVVRYQQGPTVSPALYKENFLNSFCILLDSYKSNFKTCWYNLAAFGTYGLSLPYSPYSPEGGQGNYGRGESPDSNLGNITNYATKAASLNSMLVSNYGRLYQSPPDLQGGGFAWQAILNPLPPFLAGPFLTEGKDAHKQGMGVYETTEGYNTFTFPFPSFPKESLGMGKPKGKNDLTFPSYVRRAFLLPEGKPGKVGGKERYGDSPLTSFSFLPCPEGTPFQRESVREGTARKPSRVNLKFDLVSGTATKPQTDSTGPFVKQPFIHRNVKEQKTPVNDYKFLCLILDNLIQRYNWDFLSLSKTTLNKELDFTNLYKKGANTFFKAKQFSTRDILTFSNKQALSVGRSFPTETQVVPSVILKAKPRMQYNVKRAFNYNLDSTFSFFTCLGQSDIWAFPNVSKEKELNSLIKLKSPVLTASSFSNSGLQSPPYLPTFTYGKDSISNVAEVVMGIPSERRNAYNPTCVKPKLTGKFWFPLREEPITSEGSNGPNQSPPNIPKTSGVAVSNPIPNAFPNADGVGKSIAKHSDSLLADNFKTTINSPNNRSLFSFFRNSQNYIKYKLSTAQQILQNCKVTQTGNLDIGKAYVSNLTLGQQSKRISSLIHSSLLPVPFPPLEEGVGKRERREELRLLRSPNVPLVLKHKKFMGSFSSLPLTSFGKNKEGAHSLLRKDSKEWARESKKQKIKSAPEISKVNLWQNFNKPNVSVDFAYRENKKAIQKKLRAKKQRLENRYQKKRKRFHPRPTWFKLRLAYSFSSPFPEGKRATSLVPFGKEAFATSLPCLTTRKLVALIPPERRERARQRNEGKGTGSLANLPFVHVGWASSPYKVRPEAPKALKWENALNTAMADKIIYNLWLSSKPTTLVNSDFRSVPPISSAHKERKELGLAKSAYTNNLLLSRKALIKIKNKNSKSYASFEAKSKNTTPQKKDKNNNLVRDFWVWLYNITKSNAGLASLRPLNQVIIKVDPGIAYNSNTKSLTKMNWALNKTNLWVSLPYGSTAQGMGEGAQTSTNKRLDIWSTQKLRNQSKNNKTKFIEKQLKKQLNNFFSAERIKTTYFKEQKKSYKFHISQKMHQKEQKLSYLTNIGSYKTRLNTKQLNTRILSLHSLREWKAHTLGGKNKKVEGKQALLAVPKVSSNFLSKPFAVSNFVWYKKAGFVGNYGRQRLPVLSQPAGLVEGTQHSLPETFSFSFIALLFHFCALISLISISQIRSFLQFHLILIHKLSTIYLQILRAIAHNNIKMLRNLTKQPVLWASLKGGPENLFSGAVSSPAILRSKFWLGPKGPYQSPQGKAQPRKGKTEANRKVARPYQKVLTKAKHITKGKAAIQHLLKSYTQNTQHYQKVYQNQHKTSIRNLLESFIIRTNSFPYSPEGGKGNYGRRAFPLDGLRSEGKPPLPFREVGIHSFHSEGMEGMVPKGMPTALSRLGKGALTGKVQQRPELLDNNGVYNFRNKKDILEKSSKGLRFLVKTLRFAVYFWQNRLYSSKYGGLDFVSASRPFNQNLKLKLASNQYKLQVFKTTSFNKIKKATFDYGYKIVDTFESCLRLIYSFFEKPAEFTMDWVAFAFLVEWSSDTLAFTPENNSKKTWIAFSKIAREKQNWLGFISSNAGLAVFPLLGQLLYKRILYLNDMFLEILNRPDTDLISRQRKGTLFWDIWSDVLIKAADKYNINVPSLSNIKEEQNLLIDRFLTSPTLIPSSHAGGSGLLTEGKESPKGLNKKVSQAGGTEDSLGKSFLNDLPTRSEYLYGRLRLPSIKEFTLGKPNSKVDYKNVYRHSGQHHLGFWALRAQKNGRLRSLMLHRESFSKVCVQDINQFVTYQSKETDLFLDYHPPKSFNHINSIKYYKFAAVPQTIGTLVCQIYSGIFNKQIAKNVLVISHGSAKALAASEGILSSGGAVSDTASERMQKTLLIQALAGETEMKIITDNASRYAIVNRGFAVGIKLLKDVFEAIALNTPCFFLLEDIHLIGERRPFLISDHGDSFGDDMSKATETAFGAQSNGNAGGAQAVHEKNQVYYQLSRHGITHYKKPFKGDFSLSIPTNHFSFDLFLKTRYSKTAMLDTTTSPLASSLNYDLAELSSLREGEGVGAGSNTGTISSQNSESMLNSIVHKIRSKRSNNSKFNTFLASHLQKNALSFPGKGNGGNTSQAGGFPSEGTTPTAANTVLLLKEEKTLKPRKIVKELPWVGLPTEQLALLPRVSYSVRAKVAALAELGFSNMSAKLDMITDLLVIIDSVRGNRGFVVFATTHLPHILDPALRRPGRFDETISIPTLPNLWNRWEFIKPTMVDGVYQPIITPDIGTSHGTIDYLDFLNLDFIPNNNKNLFSSLANQYKTYTLAQNKLISNLPYSQAFLWKAREKEGIRKGTYLSPPKGPADSFIPILERDVYNTHKCVLLGKRTVGIPAHIAYSQMGKKLINNRYIYSLSNFTPVYNNPTTQESSFALTETIEYLSTQNQYHSIYGSTTILRNTLLSLISGKLSTSFAITGRLYSSLPGMAFAKEPRALAKQNFLSLYGIDQTWRAVTTLAYSFVQKRYLYHKNLIVPKLLNFLDSAPLEEPPSPPTSNLLIPAKRYENYKKAFKENISFGGAQRKVTNSIQEKLEAHAKQAYIKSIYNNQTGSSPTGKAQPEGSSGLAVHSKESPLTLLGSLAMSQNPLKQASSVNWYYQNKILKRHSNYLKNQWWNGQLTEHSAETLFLSDIDWRYTFIENLNNKNLLKAKTQFFEKLKQENLILKLPNISPFPEGNLSGGVEPIATQDIVIDFPDADQHYNPKHRRWLLTSGYWSSWFNFDKKLHTEICEHLIFECFVKSYNILDKNRELLDYSAARFITKGLIKEMHIHNNIRKF